MKPKWLEHIPVCNWWLERHAIREKQRWATRELEKSKRLHAQDMIRVRHLETEETRNQFSDMVRDALAVGGDNRGSRE